MGAHDLCAERGRIVGHTSEDDGTADVGQTFGLGGGWFLWVGEITQQRWAEAGEDAARLGDGRGTWIILYGPNTVTVVGKAVCRGSADELIERLSAAFNGPATSREVGR